jgi:signal peptidase II
MADAPTRDAAARARVRARFRPGDAWFFGISALVIAVDQLTKWFVRLWIARGDSIPEDGVLRLVHTTNTGAAFGILQHAGPLLVVTSLIGMAAILLYLFNPGFAHPLMRIGLAMMLGGAIGNLIDRLRTGEVVDFIQAPHWPAFNVADSSITVGVVLLVWAMTREPQKGA